MQRLTASYSYPPDIIRKGKKATQKGVPLSLWTGPSAQNRLNPTTRIVLNGLDENRYGTQEMPLAQAPLKIISDAFSLSSFWSIFIQTSKNIYPSKCFCGVSFTFIKLSCTYQKSAEPYTGKRERLETPARREGWTPLKLSRKGLFVFFHTDY